MLLPQVESHIQHQIESKKEQDIISQNRKLLLSAMKTLFGDFDEKLVEKELIWAAVSKERYDSGKPIPEGPEKMRQNLRYSYVRDKLLAKMKEIEVERQP